jgi:hypothetical protein
LRTSIALALAASLALAAIYALAQPLGAMLVLLSDTLSVLVSGSTSILALILVRKMGAGGKLGRVNLALFLAVFLWFIGELTWAIYEVGRGVDVPYPSYADIFYLAGYGPAIVAVYGFILIFRECLTELKAALSTITGLLIVGLTYVLLLDPIMNSSADMLTRAFDVAYPTLDAVLLILAVTMVMVFEGSRTATSWLYVSTGFLLTAFADIAFSLGTLEGWYFSGHPIELLWLWGYVAMALGFYGLGEGFPNSSHRP